MQKEKREDFESRLTMIERIDYRSIKAASGRGAMVNNEASLEQVYMGAKLINESFSDVGRIDTDILKVFARLKPQDAPGRRIRRLASSLENIQYGRAHKGNCTSLEWRTVINEIRQAEEEDAGGETSAVDGPGRADAGKVRGDRSRLDVSLAASSFHSGACRGRHGRSSPRSAG